MSATATSASISVVLIRSPPSPLSATSSSWRRSTWTTPRLIPLLPSSRRDPPCGALLLPPAAVHLGLTPPSRRRRSPRHTAPLAPLLRLASAPRPTAAPRSARLPGLAPRSCNPWTGTIQMWPGPQTPPLAQLPQGCAGPQQQQALLAQHQPAVQQQACRQFRDISHVAPASRSSWSRRPLQTRLGYSIL